MSFKDMFDFLNRLENNNHKEWMDEHRNEYHQIRDWYIEWLNKLDIKLSMVDSNYTHTTGKQAINRINNNLLFHPNKPVYKDHFGAALDKTKGLGDFYIHLGIHGSFVAGGIHNPKNDILKSLRGALDYDGEEFVKILNKPSFKRNFGAMMESDMLKTAPKGYSQDHRFIDLMRYKSFSIKYDLDPQEIMASNFQDKLIDIYNEMLPFRRYLNHALTV